MLYIVVRIAKQQRELDMMPSEVQREVAKVLADLRAGRISVDQARAANRELRARAGDWAYQNGRVAVITREARDFAIGVTR